MLKLNYCKRYTVRVQIKGKPVKNKRFHVILVWTVGAIVLTTFIVFIYYRKTTEFQARTPILQNLAVPVLVDPIRSKSIRKVFNTYANLKAWKEVEILPMEKSTVQLLNFFTGDKVRKGDEIAYLSSKAHEYKKRLANI